MKVRCNLCANEIGGVCKIKKIGVSVNKSRICEAFVRDDAKLKAKSEINTIRVSFRDREQEKQRRKEEMKILREMVKRGQNQGTAKDLGLIPEESRIIQPGDPRFVLPGASNVKYPLTGDLSRFTTTANQSDKE